MVVECVVWRQTNVQLLSSEISPALPGWFTSVSLLPNLCCNIYNLHFASHSTYTNSHLQHDFLCWLYFSNYFCRLSIKFKVFALLLSLCSCSKQLAGCLHTSQREIDWGGGGFLGLSGWSWPLLSWRCSERKILCQLLFELKCTLEEGSEEDLVSGNWRRSQLSRLFEMVSWQLICKAKAMFWHSLRLCFCQKILVVISTLDFRCTT